MSARRPVSRLAVASIILAAALSVPRAAPGHPLGNFSISQYTAIRVTRDAVELRYFVDMAEIPTFQEIQDTAIVAEAGHPSLPPYLAKKVESLEDGLRLDADGQRLPLQAGAREIAFPPGVGGLPTLKIGVVYRAALPAASPAPLRLEYRDGNFPDRAGWKEIIAVAGPGVTIDARSVPERDRSRELSDYPTDLLDSPPQDREARLTISRAPGPLVAAPVSPPTPRSPRPAAPPAVPAAPDAPAPSPAPPSPATDDRPVAGAAPPVEGEALRLRPNRQAVASTAFTELVRTPALGLGIVLVALGAAAALGAFHALEPGHGKTVVAAYLVGSRGTAWHAVLLGLTVTVSHTAGVYLLGAVTLYASRYVVPERLYPWLAVLSGVTIAVLGAWLFLRRYAAPGGPHHSHGHGHAHGHHHHEHAPADPHHHHDHGHEHGHDGAPDGRVTVPALVALGVTGGIVPCPAALVVLLSAVSLNRIGFGLLLIVAFSLGLAAVLIAIGLLMVYARRLVARFDGDGPVLRRWLPLTSSALITLIGLVLTAQGLVAAGVLMIRL